MKTKIEIVEVPVCEHVECRKEATVKVRIKSASGHNDMVGKFCASHAKAFKKARR